MGPFGGGAGDLLAEHLFAAGRFELGKLTAEVLGVGRDMGIAVNHAALCIRNLHQKRPIRSSPWQDFTGVSLQLYRGGPSRGGAGRHQDPYADIASRTAGKEINMAKDTHVPRHRPASSRL